MNGSINLQMFMARGLAMVTTKQPPGKDSVQLHLWRQWPDFPTTSQQGCLQRELQGAIQGVQPGKECSRHVSHT